LLLVGAAAFCGKAALLCFLFTLNSALSGFGLSLLPCLLL
jgi:hypothetical protein